MRTKYILRAVIPLALSLAFWACDSTGYVIEEIPDEEYINNQKVQQHDAEQNAKLNTEQTSETVNNSVPEKIPTKTEVKKVYTIQIGAFRNESSAKRYSTKASDLKYELRFEIVDGLTKIRVGRFNSQSDASTVLETLKNSGYSDAFLLEFK